MRRANYPEWLLPHLEKGIYVNKTVNGYTLYRGHNVYDPVKKRSKRICDEVLGTVTEKEGFKPKKKYNKPLPNISIYTYGVYKVILDLTLPKMSISPGQFSYYKTEIIVGSILRYLHGRISKVDYDNSYLSIIYPKARVNMMTGETITSEITRNAKKIETILNGISLFEFNYVYLIKNKDTYQTIGITTELFNKAKELGADLTYEKS